MADVDERNRGERIVANLRREGIPKEELVGTYNEWSKTYVKDLEKMGYGAYRPPVEKLCELYPADKRDQVRILDVGAGTGLLGLELRKSGFTNIDGLDPSKDMMSEAQTQGIYKNYILEYITEKPIPSIKKDTYDVVMGSGMIGYTMVPYTSIYEMIRMTKPGGYVILSIRADAVTLKEHVDMVPTMDRLEREGVWRSLGTTIYPDYFVNTEGALYVYQIL